MNSIENRFYLAATDVKSSQYQNTKDNAVYVWRILFNIIDRAMDEETFEKDGLSGAIASSYLAQLMTGKLIHSNTSDDIEIGQKLKQLVLLLDNPANKDKFMNSCFFTAVVTVRNGAVKGDLDTESWINYQTYSGPRKGALNFALISYKDTPGVPVGLNIKAFLDTIIKKNDKNKYELTDISISESDKLLEATYEFIKNLKENHTFKSNYYNSSNEEENGI